MCNGANSVCQSSAVHASAEPMFEQTYNTETGSE